MSHSPFVHLRVHSAYSLSEGAIKISELAALSKQHSMPAVGIADTGNLFGALEFSTTCAKHGIQPIIGCQIGLTTTDGTGKGSQTRPDQLVVFVKDQKGYNNLLKLVSASFLKVDGGSFPQVDLKALAERSEGLIALTGGPRGPLGSSILDGHIDQAEQLLNNLHEVFGDRLYVEIMRHNEESELRSEEGFLDLAEKVGLPIVATNEVFFDSSEMFDAHEALLCISDGKTLHDDSRRRSTAEHYFKSSDHMERLFSDLPDAIKNTIVIAERCSFMVEERAPMLPQAGGVANDGSETNLINELCAKGLKDRLRRDQIPAD